MSSAPITFQGIILKTSDYKEKDRMVEVYTREYGIVHVCAKGVSGKSSKYAFVSLPYSYCDFVVTDSRGFYYLKEGNVISGNTGIMDSLEAMAVAGHIADCLSWSVMGSKDNARDCYELAIYAFYALSVAPQDFLPIMIIFNWRLMWQLGLADKADSCVNGYKLNKRELEILDFIGENTISKIFALKLEEQDISVLRGFTLDYLRNQFEKDIPDPIYKLNLPG